ncbi:unnamed protein product [Sphagnum jensenii]|uniref:Uncharacterized protein n=1 Tax=Sphagnum jensenii TaxID=128206 RepID=A0ABP0VBR4_9BRYO
MTANVTPSKPLSHRPSKSSKPFNRKLTNPIKFQKTVDDNNLSIEKQDYPGKSDVDAATDLENGVRSATIVDPTPLVQTELKETAQDKKYLRLLRQLIQTTLGSSWMLTEIDNHLNKKTNSSMTNAADLTASDISVYKESTNELDASKVISDTSSVPLESDTSSRRDREPTALPNIQSKLTDITLAKLNKIASAREHQVNKEKVNKDHSPDYLQLFPVSPTSASALATSKISNFTTDYKENFVATSAEFREALAKSDPTLYGRVKTETAEWRDTCVKHNMTVYSPISTMQSRVSVKRRVKS